VLVWDLEKTKMPSTIEQLKLQVENLKTERQELQKEARELERQLEQAKEEITSLKQRDDNGESGRGNEVGELEERLKQEVEGRIEQEQKVATLERQLEDEVRAKGELELRVEMGESELKRAMNEGQRQLEKLTETVEQVCELSAAKQSLEAQLAEFKIQQERKERKWELNVYRVVEAEQKKWEDREERLVVLSEGTVRE
jgi:chromosome segregation ATPase